LHNDCERFAKNSGGASVLLRDDSVIYPFAFTARGDDIRMSQLSKMP
jgi:hypothetical protein